MPLNRREWLTYITATMPLLIASGAVTPAIVSAATATLEHPHDALLRRLGYADARPRLTRFVSVQHGRLIDADFSQPAPFYDRILTFWEGSRGVCVVQDYIGSDRRLTEYFKLCFGSNTGVVCLLDTPVYYPELMSWGEVPSNPYTGYPHLAPTPEHPHAAWMRQNAKYWPAEAVLVSCETADDSTTTHWRSGSEVHFVVQCGDKYNAGYMQSEVSPTLEHPHAAWLRRQGKAWGELTLLSYSEHDGVVSTRWRQDIRIHDVVQVEQTFEHTKSIDDEPNIVFLD